MVRVSPREKGDTIKFGTGWKIGTGKIIGQPWRAYPALPSIRSRRRRV
jgi:hypothetical protein